MRPPVAVTPTHRHHDTTHDQQKTSNQLPVARGIKPLATPRLRSCTRRNTHARDSFYDGRRVVVVAHELASIGPSALSTHRNADVTDTRSSHCAIERCACVRHTRIERAAAPHSTPLHGNPATRTPLAAGSLARSQVAVVHEHARIVLVCARPRRGYAAYAARARAQRAHVCDPPAVRCVALCA